MERPVGETSPSIRGEPLPLWAGSPLASALASKIVPAPRREHDFQGSEGPKKTPKLTPRRLREPPAVPGLLQERLGGLLDASWPRCWVPFGPRKGPQNPSKSDLDLEANLTLAQATTHTKTANWAPQTAPPDICRLDARRGALKRPPSRATFRRSVVARCRSSDFSIFRR